MSTSTPQSPRAPVAVEKQKRRANSCLPCRESKSRCTGGIPCETCMKKRQKPRCVYRDVTSKDAEADESQDNIVSEEDEEDAEDSDHPASTSQQDSRYKDEVDTAEDGAMSVPFGDFLGPFSLPRTVDEYRLNSLSDGTVQAVVESLQTIQAFLVDVPGGRGPLSSPSSIISPKNLGEATNPLMSTESDPQLPKPVRRLYSRYLSVRHLLNTGMVTQAWTTFPSFVRELELYGLDQHNAAEDTGLIDDTVEARRRLWWHLIDLDLRLSLLVGRAPLLCSDASQFPRPTFRGLRSEEKRLQHSRLDFLQHKMEVLSFIYADKPSSIASTDERRTKQEVLSKVFDRFQEKAPAPTQESSKDVVHSIAVAEHQLDIHLFSIVFNHHLARTPTSDQMTGGREKPPGATRPGKSRSLRKQAAPKTFKDMLQSARRVMEIFDYIHTLDASNSTLSWTHCVGAYSAALILGVARLRQEIELDTDSSRIQQTLTVFQELITVVPNLSIAQLAISSLEILVRALKNLDGDKDTSPKAEPVQKRSPKMSVMSETPSGGLRVKAKKDIDPVDTNFRRKPKRPNPSTYEDEPPPEKRARFSTLDRSFDAQPQNAPSWPPSQEQQYVQHVSSFRDMPMGSFHEQAAPSSFEQPSFPPSASTSFTGNEPIEYNNLDYSAQDNSHPYNTAASWYHPPMSIHPPMYDSHWQAQGQSFAMLGTPVGQHSFYGDPTPMAMTDAHHLEQQMHNPQTMMLNNIGHGNPQHSDVTLKDNSVVPGPPPHGSLGPEQPQSQQDTSFYSTADESQYVGTEHSASSPIMGNTMLKQEALFAHPANSNRRRSTADIHHHHQQQQRGGWTIETPANYNDPKYRGKGKHGQEGSRSPQRDGLLSPLSEGGPQSRRNSATPRQIAQQGMPVNVPQHLDFSLEGSVHPPMLLPMHMIHNEDYPGSRRQSLAHGVDVAMGEVNMNVQPSGPPLSEQAPTWQGQPVPPPNQSHFDTTGTMNYDIDMTNNPMAYNAQFHHHQQLQHQHHPHHDFPAPTRQIVTTGPFPGDTRWWGA